MLLHLAARGGVNYADLCKYPAVRRDLALLLNEDTTFAQIEAISRQAERKLLKHVELFDVYEGKGLPAGKKSYAVAFTLQDEVKTMSDKQIEKSMTRIVEALKQQLGAQLR
jgi:phenylalanyl-tRNA synthetase beta chain